MKLLKSVLLLSLATLSVVANFSINSLTAPDSLHYTLTLEAPLAPDDYFYADYFNFSVDNPAVTITNWQIQPEAVTHYDPVFKAPKKTISGNPIIITLALELTQESPINSALHVTYYQRSNKTITQEMIPLSLGTPSKDLNDSTVASPVDQHATTSKSYPSPATPSKKISWACYLQSVLETSNSFWLQLLLALLMGILLSLTPCIYPMIPITVGILQSGPGQSSFWNNFARALAYTLGIATTFACLGILAAFTGQLFGSLLQNPFVIFSIVGLLIYLAGSMLGFYELYTPSFLNNSGNSFKGGSLISAFLFGALSGTIASPCVSPGLLFLLTYVTTLANKFLGFALLFAFGVGISVPLLIVGTFSNSLSLLPRAGMWMVEVKKFFGFILLATCLYFLNIIIPPYITWWLLVALLFFAGVFYLNETRTTYANKNGFKKTLGSILIISSVLVAGVSFQMSYTLNTDECASVWMNHYGIARQTAQDHHKLLLLEVSGPFCSICKAIEKKIFLNADVQQALAQVIPIKIENLAAVDESAAHLQSTFAIKGVPAIIVIDPVTEKEIYRWGGELYDQTPEEFIATLNELVHNKN